MILDKTITEFLKTKGIKESEVKQQLKINSPFKVYYKYIVSQNLLEEFETFAKVFIEKENEKTYKQNYIKEHCELVTSSGGIYEGTKDNKIWITHKLTKSTFCVKAQELNHLNVINLLNEHLQNWNQLKKD